LRASFKLCWRYLAIFDRPRQRGKAEFGLKYKKFCPEYAVSAAFGLLGA